MTTNELMDPHECSIQLLGAPILRQKCPAATIDNLPNADMLELSGQMIDSLPSLHAVGLAANQIGERVRLMVLGDRAEVPEDVEPTLYQEQARLPFEPYAIINPQLTANIDAGWSAWFEGCLSIPGLTGVVSRWNEVLVEGYSPAGARLQFSASGWHARILQHEVDHLDGRVYTDLVLRRTLMYKSEHRAVWRGRPMSSVFEELNVQPTKPVGFS